MGWWKWWSVIWTRRGFDDPHVLHKEKYLAGCSKSSSGEAAGELNPEVYPLNLHRLVHIMQRRFGDLACPGASLCHDVVQV